MPAGLPYGRPVRRRVALPGLLVAGLVLSVVLVALHDQVVYYRVDSGSMAPTLPIGSRVAVEPGVAPKVGEIVAFHAPAGAVPATPVCGNPGQGAGFPQACGLSSAGPSKAIFVKRIVAGPGAELLIRNGRAVVDGVTENEPPDASCGGPDCNFPTPIRVPAGDFYVLGDNRGASDDSRFWGPISASSILGVLVTCRPLQTACQPRH
ncbi:MAG TPA: signal peptidase I [Solirubrobacteraceae bacterium]|nr:signal peptidase I [Solirubrobacteraceae bacterium]